MIKFDFEEPDTKPGYCPECYNKADIWDDRRRVWECNLCNWSGRLPSYTISDTDKERLAYYDRTRTARS